MTRINIPVEIPETMDNFLKLLPLSIRKKYMSKMTSAIIKENEKQIIESVSGVVQDMMQILISEKDEEILQLELDRALEDIGVSIDGSKKKVSGKKRGNTSLKKLNTDSEKVEDTVLTSDIMDQVDHLKTTEKKERTNSYKNTSNDNDVEIDSEEISVEKEIKRLDLSTIFNQ